ncbi:hypothetical protein D3C78_1865770 [compost metagenome]
MSLLISRHAGAVVLHFEDCQLAVGVAEQGQPDFGLIVQQGAVAPAIAQQIVENLRELIGVHQRGEVP